MITIGSYVIVYAGPNYGRVHKVVDIFGNTLTCERDGRKVIAHKCDVETVEVGTLPMKEAA